MKHPSSEESLDFMEAVAAYLFLHGYNVKTAGPIRVEVQDNQRRLVVEFTSTEYIQ